ncbi:hypothetical protein [Paucibacter soli]|uniref:hypothetical protein n=1 Tax=Paucibacter soli TaxID=3133433 RepID=UPI0030ACC007
MKVFVDTEFTDFKNPLMLSAGLVAENGAEFYLEVSAPKVHAKASPFVQDIVLPQFGQHPATVVTDYAQAGEALAQFLISLDGELVLCADYPTDLYLVVDALQKSALFDELRSRLSVLDIAKIVTGDENSDRWAEAFDKHERSMKLLRHHALLDARALKDVYQAALAARANMVQARHDYHLQTIEAGKILGRAWTNDDEDRGYPSAESQWEVSYKDRAQALERTGGTHTGMNGCQVNVYLDGRLVDREGKPLEEPKEPRRLRP